jgi:uncharacterized protein DUF3106
MKQRFQFGAWVCGLGLSAALLAPSASAQNRPSNDRPPARQQQQAPHEANRPPRNDRPSGSYHPQNSPRGGNANRQPTQADRQRSSQDGSRMNGNTRTPGQDYGRNNRGNDRAQNLNRQQAPAIPPPNVQERWRNMSPQERNRLAENQRKFNQLPPQRQQDMKRAAENWEKLTPEQRNHIKNDVLPRWQQLPADRQRAIQQRLGVLQNMPESARNRHLSDPNFTRGMSEEDRQMLRDLSHQHVGAPDQPQEQ